MNHASMKRPRKSGIALALCLVFSLPHQVFSQWSGAAIDTLTRDTFRDDVDKQSIAVDAANTLHAVWKRANTGGGWRLFYASKPQFGTWSSPREIADSTLLIFEYAVAVDRQSGTPYVAYGRESAVQREIFLAEDSAGTWVHTRITENATEDLSPTIALDNNGFVHLAWIGQDSAANWKIMYATNIGGPFQTQLLGGSDLGPFGSGAEPYIAVTPLGLAHIFYRGGDFGTYRIHHAWNNAPGGTTWNYDILATPNGNDFAARAVITQDTTIHLLASGNDGFGFPPRVFYTRKSPGGTWTTPERANPSGSGWGGSLFIDRFGKAHITWDEVSGNIYTGNLFYSSNRTGSWTNAAILADGKTYNGVVILDSAGRGHAIAYNGDTFSAQEIFVIHSPGPLTSVDEARTTMPAGYKLFQNYPNPFNSGTAITYVTPEHSHVTITVHTILGQEVATLVREIQQPGTHTVSFDATGVPSGVYFCRMTAGLFSQQRKMIVVK